MFPLVVFYHSKSVLTLIKKIHICHLLQMYFVSIAGEALCHQVGRLSSSDLKLVWFIGFHLFACLFMNRINANESAGEHHFTKADIKTRASKDTHYEQEIETMPTFNKHTWLLVFQHFHQSNVLRYSEADVSCQPSQEWKLISVCIHNLVLSTITHSCCKWW